MVLLPLEKIDPPLVVRQLAVVIEPWLVERFLLVVLMLAFENRLCAHMVLPVPGCGGHVSVLSLLKLHFPLFVQISQQKNPHTSLHTYAKTNQKLHGRRSTWHQMANRPAD